MKKYSYIIKSKTDIKKIALATFKRVNSPTVMPRVATNRFLDVLIAGSFGAVFLCQIYLPLQSFKRYVHAKNFDLGIYFSIQNNQLFATIVDGTGHFASNRTKSIFDDIMLKNNEDFKNEQKTQKNIAKNMNFDSLLVDISC